MKHTLALLTALLLAPLAPLPAADKPAKPNPDQIVGIDPSDGDPASARSDPPMLIPDPNGTADYARAKRTCTGVPSIAVSRGGRIWAAWYSGKTPGAIIERCPHSYTVVSTSGDGGKTWKEVLAIDPDGAGPLKAYDPQPWVDPDGKLWVFWHHTGGSQAWAITADDAEKENPTWSQPRPITSGIMMNKPAILSNGDWLFAVNQRKTGTISLVKALVSNDQGRTFTEKGNLEISYDLKPCEPMIVERKDGSLWMLTRSQQGISESISTDGGTTWGELKAQAIKHTASRFFISRLQSGHLLLIKHMGLDVDLEAVGRSQRRELMAFISKDDGKTWSKGLMLDDRNGVSYPDAQQTADGTIYLIWDFARSKEQEILMTTFREEDVLAANEDAIARVKANRRLVSKGGTTE
ncbi:MAG: exo-alpha-sialidase [Verrucomicrobia bacterium]|nr:exo-alpha-sialidase [Verrucomicrobiota bacterium]